MATSFHDVEEAGDVGFDIIVRMREAVAHAGLCREVNDPVEAVVGEGLVDSRLVGKIGAHECPGTIGAARRLCQKLEPPLFERRIVVGVDHVETDDLIAAL